LKPVEKQTYPAALVEDAVDHEEDRTHYPIPNWYPPDAIIITAEERRTLKNTHKTYSPILRPNFIKQ